MSFGGVRGGEPTAGPGPEGGPPGGEDVMEARRVASEGAEMRVWGPRGGRSETVGARGKAGWS